jgi:hypothetical protein
MTTQNYKNHIRYYLPHHLFFYSAIAVLLIICSLALFSQSENFMLWLVITLLVFLVGLLSLMLRQHYALTNQNRIVRLEMRLRYYVLTQKRFELLETQLSPSQVFALRYAADDELLLLIEKTLAENLSPDAIKRSIKNWQPDNMRV